MDVKYTLMTIKGKHGKINLMIPERKPSKKEINTLYQVIAESIVNSAKTTLEQ